MMHTNQIIIMRLSGIIRGGSSVTLKGVDIFAKEETKLVSATHGIILAKGNISKGGNFVLILGPKWRLYYYAHLKKSST